MGTLNSECLWSVFCIKCLYFGVCFSRDRVGRLMCGRSCLNHAVMDTAGFRLGDEFGCSQSPIYRRQTRHMAQLEECSQRPRTLIALSLEVESHPRQQVAALTRGSSHCISVKTPVCISRAMWHTFPGGWVPVNWSGLILIRTGS